MQPAKSSVNSLKFFRLRKILILLESNITDKIVYISEPREYTLYSHAILPARLHVRGQPRLPDGVQVRVLVKVRVQPEEGPGHGAVVGGVDLLAGALGVLGVVHAEVPTVGYGFSITDVVDCNSDLYTVVPRVPASSDIVGDLTS